MTEAEWLAATDPGAMFQWLRDRTPPPTERKWRLLLAGCARQVWGQIPPGQNRETVETAERYADGGAADEELKKCQTAYYTVTEAMKSSGKIGFQIHALTYASTASMRIIHRPHITTYWSGISPLAGEYLPGLLRCVFGNPHRPVVTDPSWHTPEVLALAGQIYADRTFDRLSILADALHAVGCDEPDVLAHCSVSGPHVRGCWVLDQLLGRE